MPKKNKRRTAGKLSLNVNNRRKLKKASKIKFNFSNPLIQEKWDYKKSLRQNYQDLGLTYDLNEIKPRVDNIVSDEPMVLNKDENSIIDDLLQTAIKPGPSKKQYFPRNLSIREQKICRNLISVHGNDIKAMFRDTKNNILQLTEKQIERKLGIYKDLQSLNEVL